MFKTFALTLGGIGFSIVATHASGAEFFRYVTGFVPSSSLSCDADAAAFGARFQLATALEVFSTSCAEDGFGARKLELSYIGDRPVGVVSAMRGRFWDADVEDTMPSGPFSTDALFGRYSDYSSCFAAIPGEVFTYETQTGLPAVAAYCEAGTAGGISLRIDGFGAPRSRYRQQNVEFRGEVDLEMASLVADVVRAGGATIIEAEPWGPYALVSFYGSIVPLVPFAPNYDGIVDGPEQCEFELGVALSALATIRGSQPLISKCLSSGDSPATHLNFAFARSAEGLGFSEIRGPTFGTYATCSSNRDRSVEAMRRTSGRDVRAAVCVRTSSVDPSDFVLIGLAF